MRAASVISVVAQKATENGRPSWLIGRGSPRVRGKKDMIYRRKKSKQLVHCTLIGWIQLVTIKGRKLSS